jgi:hypothetical protein
VARAFGAYELGAPKNFTQEQIFDIQTWPHLDDGMLHSTSEGSGC